jgi:uncharacterized RDD family membrane protein YckC
MFCSKCGKEILDDSVFCYSCGTNLKILEHKEDTDTILDSQNDFQDLNKKVINVNLPTLGVSFRRILSFIIDLVLLWTIFYIFEESTKKFISETIEIIITITFTIVYYTLMESSSFQGTFGKIITGIIVSDYNGNKISFKMSFIRTLVKVVHVGFIATVVSGMIILMWEKRMISTGGKNFLYFILSNYFILPIIITKKKQSLHDYFVNTVVIRKPKK